MEDITTWAGSDLAVEPKQTFGRRVGFFLLILSWTRNMYKKDLKLKTSF